MAESEILIGNKKVFKSQPFLPEGNKDLPLVGREAELKLITAAWISGKNTPPLNPLLVGDPGVGKNRLVYEIANKTNRNLYIFQGHEDVTTEDLACSVRFSDSHTVMDYILSPLVTAMKEGGICFIDEIGKIRPRALALLVSVLDERRYIDSTLLGERIFAHKDFRFVAATNTTDINLMPEFMLSRMKPVIKVGYPSKKEIEQIILTQIGSDEKEIKRLLSYFWFLWDEHKSKNRILSPRDAIYLFGLASNFSVQEALIHDPREDNLKTTSNPGSDCPLSKSSIKPEHLKLAFDKYFENNLNNAGQF